MTQPVMNQWCDVSPRLTDAVSRSPTSTVVADPLAGFSEPTRAWFADAFERPTRAQELGWRAISEGRHTLLHAPTGSGKTLAAFLWCLDRLFTQADAPERERRCRVLYISPLKAL